MSAVTKPPSPLSMRTQKCTFYAWFTLARKTENKIKQSAIFRRGKSWNMDVRIPEPPLSANLLPPPECGRLLWTAPNDKLRGYNDYLTIAKTMYTPDTVARIFITAHVAHKTFSRQIQTAYKRTIPVPLQWGLPYQHTVLLSKSWGVPYLRTVPYCRPWFSIRFQAHKKLKIFVVKGSFIT